MAQLHELPAIIRDFSDNEVLEVAIIENIQRSDLNPVEEAAGYRQLMDRFGRTQEQMAEALGKSRSHIANLLRLLGLPTDVQAHLKEGRLTIGHARALITTENASELAQIIISKGLSVRDTEKLVKKSANGQEIVTSDRKSNKGSGDKDADTKALEGDLSAAIGMKVQVNHHSNKESGEVTISYTSLDQLDDICRMLNVSG
jgi:ParB family chromosome partitioning protein